MHEAIDRLADYSDPSDPSHLAITSAEYLFKTK